jgi:hypothetical protein
LRFDPSAGLGLLSGIFSSDKKPSLAEIMEALKTNCTFELAFFKDRDELKELIRENCVK